jgi:hypothetical protein
VAHELLVGLHARAPQRRPVAVHPLLAGAQPWRPGDDADPPVPQRHQVFGRGQPAGPVGRPDRGERGRGVTHRVQQDHRRLEGGQPVGGLRVTVADDHHDTVAAPPGDPVEPGPRAGVVVAGGVEHDLPVGAPGLGLGAPQHLHRPERVEAVDDHVDQPGPASRRPAATAVAALGDDLLHQLAGGPGDVGPPVEDLRDGRDRDTRLFGDLGDRHTAAFHARTLSKVSKIVVDTSHLDGPVRAL